MLPSASVDSGLRSGESSTVPNTGCDSEARSLEECMAILSDPQVSSIDDLVHFGHKEKDLLYLSNSCTSCFPEGSPFSE